MNEISLGRLQKISLRDAWKDEAKEFTPWLAKKENLALLGGVLDLELELLSQEEQVGPFRADLLCKSGEGEWVVIENQLDKTDHKHLGQLVTYASGLDAVTIVWIAGEFDEEHRSALDWLNQISDSQHNFFGLEIELWRIGESLMAPKFNIISKPNDWTRRIQSAASGQLRDTEKLQLEYWTEFKASLPENSRLRLHKAPPSNTISCSVGRSGAQIQFAVSSWDPLTNTYSDPYIRVELYLYEEDSKVLFEKLLADKINVETEIGSELFWYNPDDIRACRIWLKKDADYTQRDQWREQFKWFKETGELLHRVFAKKLKTI